MWAILVSLVTQLTMDTVTEGICFSDEYKVNNNFHVPINQGTLQRMLALFLLHITLHFFFTWTMHSLSYMVDESSAVVWDTIQRTKWPCLFLSLESIMESIVLFLWTIQLSLGNTVILLWTHLLSFPKKPNLVLYSFSSSLRSNYHFPYCWPAVRCLLMGNQSKELRSLALL